MDISSTDAAYAAGMLDGEGSIDMKRNRQKLGNYNLRVAVVNTNREVLEWFQPRFGGKVSPHSGKEALEKGWKPSWAWWLTDRKNMERFLTTVFPYLIIKRKRAQLALGYMVATETEYGKRHCRRRPLSEAERAFRGRVWAVFKSLNQRGLPS